LPVFHTDADARFVIGTDLFTKSILDIVPILERDDNVWIDDGVKGQYLVGLAQDFEVVVVRLDDDGAPDAFAVVPGVVDWNGHAVESGDSAFGAAFKYRDSDWSRVEHYFASNEGWGIFQLELPFAVPAPCWNTGFDTDAHVVCSGESATLLRTFDSEDASSNDGMNCPAGAPLSLQLAN
jgi:hypothetical protein